jgi:soluble lytic murein transglycosylase-like protein
MRKIFGVQLKTPKKMDSKKIKSVFVFTTLGIILSSFILIRMTKETSEDIFKSNLGKVSSTYSLKMYESIEKYSDKYEIPKYIAYNIAYLETRYRGPFDFRYNGSLVSSAGAKGPMQILPTTANYISGKSITNKELLHNVELNVEISMKLLNKLHKSYNDWSLVCGYYNTGYPKVNDYAQYCVQNKDYTEKWVSYNKF